MISIRFYLHPNTFKQSFLHPTESLFIPAAVISMGTILINITQYGVDYAGEWLNRAMVPLYWIYCTMAVLSSWGIFLTIWSTQTFTIAKMTPVWIFPAYPLLICGPHAGNIAKKLSPEEGLPVIIAGFILQGIGFMVSLVSQIENCYMISLNEHELTSNYDQMVYSAFLYRLMTQKLPKESLRPAMFISVGPSGFTITAFIQMGRELPRVVDKDFMGEGMGEFVGRVTMVLANWAGMWLWGLAIWLFLVSVGAHYSCTVRGKLDFAMTWYSFVFPNTALTTATFSMSYALHGDLTEAIGFSRGARPFQILGCIMTVALVALWFFVFAMMIRAVITKQILWPQKQEDRDEGGWGKDEIVRKGEIKSFMPSRQTSQTALNSMGHQEPHLVVKPPGEGISQGIAIDSAEIDRAAAKNATGGHTGTDEIDLESGEKAEVLDTKADDEALYLTTSRKKSQDQLGDAVKQRT
jgi:tellurite resistance protein TehA-like permease